MHQDSGALSFCVLAARWSFLREPRVPSQGFGDWRATWSALARIR